MPTSSSNILIPRDRPQKSLARCFCAVEGSSRSDIRCAPETLARLCCARRENICIRKMNKNYEKVTRRTAFDHEKCCFRLQSRRLETDFFKNKHDDMCCQACRRRALFAMFSSHVRASEPKDFPATLCWPVTIPNVDDRRDFRFFFSLAFCDSLFAPSTGSAGDSITFNHGTRGMPKHIEKLHARGEASIFHT